MTQKKELKDFIHLYLGCEVEWSGETGYRLAGINTGQTGFNPVGLVWIENDTPVWVNYDKITLLLRPLSDMTEEEGAETWKISTSHGDTRTLNAKKTAYLLSRHFDLFGLIEAGLAKDKTQMK